MKKSIIKNLIALTFALGALVFVAGNVFGGENPNEDDCPEAPAIVCKCTKGFVGFFSSCKANGSTEYTCSGGGLDHLCSSGSSNC